MKEFIADKFLVKLMDHNNLEEVKKVQTLRYKHLLRDYNPSLPLDGLDDDGYDDYSDSILVIDTQTNEICGTYRVASLKTTKGHKFLTDDEYDIEELKRSGFDFVELGRAVVHPDYRSGYVIQILFLAVYRYMLEHDCKYCLGLCSFHGNDPTIYKNALTYLKRNYLFTDYTIKAVSNTFELDLVEGELDREKVNNELPGLLKMYLKFGNKVAYNGSIDYSFNSCDVLVIVDIKDIDIRYINHFSKLIKKEVA